MIIGTNEIKISGLTYSVVNPYIYEEYRKTKDAELFEELVSDLILNKYSDCLETNEFILSLPKRDQRLAIMSLIDKETKGDANLVWAEMKAYVDSRVDKMDHVKDVIRIINKFVKDGAIEKKTHGEVMTPISLVREMLSTLPEEVWSNPNLKWLDPANGAGTFPFVVIYKLMKGLEEWEPDLEKRYKHIIENMIYTCELQSRNVFLWMCGVDPYDEYTTNTYWGSFLDEGFDYHMKNVWSVDKFDIVIGNPPYQERKDGNKKTQSLWNLFVVKSIVILKNDGFLCFVHPGSWRNYSGNFENIKQLFLNRDILYLNINNYDSGNEMFGVSTDFDFYLIRNSHNDVVTKIIDVDNCVYNMKLSNIQFIPNKNIKTLLDLTHGDDKIDTIMDSSYHTQRDFLSKNKTEEFKYPIIYTVKSSGEPVFWYSKINDRGHFGIPKLVFSNGAGSGVFIDEDGSYGLSQFSYGIVDRDVYQLNFIKNIMIDKKFINLLGYGSGSKYNKNILRIFEKKSWDRLSNIIKTK